MAQTSRRLNLIPAGLYLLADTWGAYTWGAYTWGAYTWGAYTWGAYTWGAYTWGAYTWGAYTWGLIPGGLFRHRGKQDHPTFISYSPIGIWGCDSWLQIDPSSTQTMSDGK